MSMNLELGLGSVHGAAGERRTELQPAMHALIISPLLPSCIAAGTAPASPQHRSLQGSHHFNSIPSFNILLDQLLGSPLPPGWEQCLDLKSGDVFYKNLSTGTTTHMDPRALTAEKSGDDYRHSRASQTGTLIRTNNIEAPGANQVHDCDHIKFALGTAIRQEKPYSQERLSGDVDLDLRLSSFFPVENAVLYSRSSSMSSHDSSMHVQSYSSVSCISDASMPELPDNRVMHNVKRVDHNGSVWHGSMSFSSSSSPSALSYQNQLHDDGDEDETLNGDADISRSDANDGTGMKMVTAACAHCLMFVLLSSTKEPLRCPLCGNHANPLKDL